LHTSRQDARLSKTTAPPVARTTAESIHVPILSCTSYGLVNLGFVHINHTSDERNAKIALETCDRCKRMVEGQVGQPLSDVLDQGLRAYPLRDMPELPSGRRTATQDYPTSSGQYQ